MPRGGANPSDLSEEGPSSCQEKGKLREGAGEESQGEEDRRPKLDSQRGRCDQHYA